MDEKEDETEDQLDESKRDLLGSQAVFCQTGANAANVIADFE